MPNVSVLTSMTALKQPFVHVDGSVFPDDTNWFKLFEYHVLEDVDNLRLYYSRDTERGALMLMPLRRQVRRTGAIILQAVQNYYSVDYRPVCSTVFARSLIPSTITYIIQSGDADVVILKPMDAEAPETDIIADSFRRANWFVFEKNCQANWIHNLEGTYDQYLRSRPKRLRNTIKRKTSRLLNMPGVDLTIHNGSTNLDSLIFLYNKVYERSWKENEPHAQFIPELIKAIALRGQLRLGLLTIDDNPVAVHFWIVKNAHAYIYKLAHDASYDQYSPGTVLMAEMIRNAIEKDSVKKLDFLSGDDSYKRDWMDECRFKVEIMAYNSKSLRGVCSFFLDQCLRPLLSRVNISVKRLLKKSGQSK